MKAGTRREAAVSDVPVETRDDIGRVEGGPRVWALLGARVGDNHQVLALAETLGWPYRTFRVKYNPLFGCPNWMLGASRTSVRACTPPMAPPWPDLVLAIGRRSVPLARWIRARAGGRTKLVQLGRPRAPLHWFDLIVTTPQYGLPARANVLHSPLPIQGIDRQRHEAAARAWAPRLAELPRPWIAVLVGGPVWGYRLHAATARRIASAANAEARRAGGSLLISTAPRTPPRAAAALEEAIEVPHHRYRWDLARGRDNPYVAFIALADRLMVTEESVSALAEACSSGRPVTVLPLDRQPGTGFVARLGGGDRGVFAKLADAGIATPPRQISAVHHELVRLGLAHWADGALHVVRPPNGASDPAVRAAERIRRLMSRTEPAEGAPDR